MRWCSLKGPPTEKRKPRAMESRETWVAFGSCLSWAGPSPSIQAYFLLFPSLSSALLPMVPWPWCTQAFVMSALLESFSFLPSYPYFAYCLRPKAEASLSVHLSFTLLFSWFFSASRRIIQAKTRLPILCNCHSFPPRTFIECLWCGTSVLAAKCSKWILFQFHRFFLKQWDFKILSYSLKAPS